VAAEHFGRARDLEGDLKKNNERMERPLVRRSNQKIALCIAALLALLAADLLSKEWVSANLSADRGFDDPPPVCMPDEHGRRAMQRVRTEPITVIDDFIELRYAENCGAAFGLMDEAPPLARAAVFGVAAVVASAVLFVMFVQGRGAPFFAASVPMIISGALGNLVDRIRFGYVVDFIRVFNLPISFLQEWPTFNVADIGITAGVILLLMDGYAEARREKREKELAAGGGSGGPGKQRKKGRAAAN